MNAFTKKPDTSWVKQLQRDAKSGKAAQAIESILDEIEEVL